MKRSVVGRSRGVRGAVLRPAAWVALGALATGGPPACASSSSGGGGDGGAAAGASGGSGGSGAIAGGSGGAGAHAGGDGGLGGAGTSGAGGTSPEGGGGSGAAAGHGGASSGGAGGGSTGSGGSGGGGAGGGSTGSGGSGGSGGNPVDDACGLPGDGVWFEIDYSSAFTATNPDWLFSPTPGFGEPAWAPSGSSWPEVWDVYNNIAVTNDPIGKLAALGPSSTLQVMLGLTTLQSYSHATVCVEGRSISSSSSVTFDVYNPLNGCGASASMSHDWTVHAVGVDIGDCMLEGVDFQALRIEPSGGSSALGIVRLRLTLHDAVY
ncbi:MAG: hypothetical protein IT373_13430 [Polyangiaceae bacterium]|nr:hypothetical protein [Polyangiaceae bacterium]